MEIMNAILELFCIVDLLSDALDVLAIAKLLL